jgi:hypothetical protein
MKVVLLGRRVACAVLLASSAKVSWGQVTSFAPLITVPVSSTDGTSAALPTVYKILGASSTFSNNGYLAGSMTGTNVPFGASVQSAWVYSPTSGLSVTGSYTANVSGYHYTMTTKGVSAAGNVIGSSGEYVASSTSTYSGGTFAWETTPGGQVVTMGFTGSGFNYPETVLGNAIVVTNSSPDYVNAAGQVAGNSTRYSGTSYAGSAVWIYNPSTATTTQIGLTGPGNSSNAYSFNQNVAISSSGHVIGTAPAYAPTSVGTIVRDGTDGWLYTPGYGSQPIGLAVSGLTPSVPGYSSPSNPYSYTYAVANSTYQGRTTNITAVNASGQVGGSSYIYNSSGAAMGGDAFIYTPGATPGTGTYTTVGLLTDGLANGDTVGYVSPAGVRSNFLNVLNDAGQSAGTAGLYSQTSFAGQDAWFASATGVVTRVGLFGQRYTNGFAGGGRSSTPTFLTSNGLLAGFSNRYGVTSNPLNSLGQDAWIYDSNTGVTYTIDPAHAGDPNGGPYNGLWALSQISSLTTNAYAVGTYGFSSTSTSNNTRYAYFWSPASGLVDLGMSPSLAAAGFSSITSAFYVNADATVIYASGTDLNGNAAIAKISVASSWATDASTPWDTGASWASGTAPNAAGSLVVLGSAITAPRTITLDAPITVGSLTFSSTNAYTVSGSNALTVSGAYTGILKVTAGSHAITAPVQLATSTAVSISPRSKLTLESVSTVDAARAEGLTVTGGGTLALGQYAAGPLTIDAASKVDLGTGSAILSGTTESAVRAYIESGNLISSASRAITGLGVITNDDGSGTGTPLYPTFEGVTSGDSDVLVMYTYLGDTTLKGYVDGTDLSNTLAGMNGGLTGWANGDFNYDGVVDALDLHLLLDSLASQGAPLGGSGTSGAVPEPALGGSALACGILFGLRNRRRAHAQDDGLRR